MEQIKRIGKLKKSEKEILNDIYTVLFYTAVALFFLFIFYFSIASYNPVATIIISVIMAIIYTHLY